MTSRKSMEKGLAEMQRHEWDKRHGTTTGYRYGCRCEECKEAHSAYSREWRSRYWK